MAGHGRRTQRDARRRALAQNFLARPVLAAEIAELASIGPDDLVVEIGSGSGRLTSELVRRAREVWAVEPDPVWASRLRTLHVRVIEGDALHVRLPDEPYRVVANLPFNRTTAFLRRLLDDERLVCADLVVQWEVALKHVSICRPSLVSLGWAPWWRFAVTARLPATAFRPVPSVDAALLRIVRREPSLLDASERARYLAFIRRAFDGRPPERTVLEWLDAYRRRYRRVP